MQEVSNQESLQAAYSFYTDPPLKHDILSALGAQRKNETPPCVPLRRQGGEGTRVLYARGAGTEGKTCTLTSWYDPSPLRPGVGP